MNEKIKFGEINKFYLCLVHGAPSPREAVLHAYLKKDSKNNTVEVRDTEFIGSKEIITGYKILKTRGDRSLLEIRLFTGRTHQIRAHMAHIGHPLIGDGKYGINREDKREGYKYQALYSYKLIFAESKTENCLSYLDGREFVLEDKDIWFLKEI